MRFAYPDILGFQTPWRSYAWSPEDVILYALALGLGRDPTDETRLPFVQEAGLQVLPTFATMAAFRAGISPTLLGIPAGATAHAGQSAVFHRVLPPAGAVRASSRVMAVHDRGAGRSAVLETETVLRDEGGAPVATLRRTGLLRGLGGFGGPAPPKRRPGGCRGTPDASIDIPTRPDQALLYRLCGDRNPLHADPAVARRAGFARPILHGLATFGLVGSALMQNFGDMEPGRLRALSMQFAGPIYPGETVRLEMWRSAAGVSFEATAIDRGEAVVREGIAEIGRATL